MLLNNNDQPTIAFQSDPIIELYKQDVDRTLLAENLLLTVQQRVEKLMRLQQFAEELRRAGKQLEEQR